jgi:Sulfotransferase family
MVYEESASSMLAVTVTSHVHGPLSLVSLLKRAPKALGWKVVKAFWLLTREGTGWVHRLQRRRIAHFLHIGKTGGTAVASVLSRHPKSTSHEIILHEHHFKLNDVPRGEKVFFFVRDPISRFVSGFYSRQRQGRPRHDVPWSPSEAAAFARFATPNELALALSSNDKSLQSAAVNAIRGIIHLNEPHWTWFKDERYFSSRESDVLFIGFQESLSEDFALLKRILNLSEDASLPEDSFASHKNPVDVDKRLDEEAVRNLRIWYARDYRFLERCREISTRIQRDWERPFSESTPSDPTEAWRSTVTSQSPQAGTLG